MKITQTRLKKIIQEELAAVAEGYISPDDPPVAVLPEDVQLAVTELQTIRNMLMGPGELPKPNLVAGKILNAIGNIKSHFGVLQEGMFGLTTDGSCKDQLDKQNNMWMSRVNSLYQALRAIDGAAADMALDNAGMTAGDLRPAEPMRSYHEKGDLEEGRDGPSHEASTVNKPRSQADCGPDKTYKRPSNNDHRDYGTCEEKDKDSGRNKRLNR